MTDYSLDGDQPISDLNPQAYCRILVNKITITLSLVSVHKRNEFEWFRTHYMSRQNHHVFFVLDVLVALVLVSLFGTAWLGKTNYSEQLEIETHLI